MSATPARFRNLSPMADLLVLGSGIAGLSAAIHAARRGMSVVVLTKGELALSATRYAQGGVAAALEAPDSAELHLSDTLAAGAGLCDPDAVRVLVTEGPGRVRDLMALGAVFDRTGDGATAALALAREGGHSVSRVVHAGGDATGAEIERALVAAVHSLDLVDVRERCFAVDLIMEGGRCVGVPALDPAGAPMEIRAHDTIIATGGAGQLFAVTTNPVVSTGDGIALALRAGAAVADIEFMQFHPTALHHPSMPRPLLSEALRGEGAVLRDEHGVAFMADEHPLSDLAPRDVVSRAITRRLVDRDIDHLWLDATGHRRLSRPLSDHLGIRAVGGPRSGPRLAPGRAGCALPLRWRGDGPRRRVDGPRAVVVRRGRVLGRARREPARVELPARRPRLRARVVDAIVAKKDGPEPTGVLRAVSVSPGQLVPGRPSGREAAPAAITLPELQRVMTAGAGVLRDAASLQGVLDVLPASVPAHDPDGYELRNLLVVGWALTTAALARQESRGTHTRLDFPDRSSALLGRFFQVGEALTFHALPVDVRQPSA